MPVRVKLSDCLKIIIYKGKSIPLKTEAKDTILKSKNTTNQLKITKKKTTLKEGITAVKANKTPKLVATPFPPLNLKNSVQL